VNTYRWFIVGAATVVMLQALVIVALVIERTRRRQRDVALGNGRKRYAMATAAARSGVWDWDLQTNVFRYDPSLKAILGYEDHEIGNHFDDWLKLVHPDDAPAVMPRVHEHLEGRSPCYELEHRLVHRDGSTRWFLTRGSAVALHGRPVRVIGIDIDITARKTSEQACASTFAHDVRQPLTAIIMNARSCLRRIAGESPDLAEVRAGLLDMVDAGQRAEEVIQRNRELLRQHTAQTETSDINGRRP
jgi:PAS domain S-box-containing protein